MRTQEITPFMPVKDLKARWSPRALKLLATTTYGRSGVLTVFKLYLKHMLNCGVHYCGFGFAPIGIGMGTYQEIRRCLMRNGFPDLSLNVFELGYGPGDSTETALRDMLEKWATASRKERRALIEELGQHWSDGC